MNAKRKKKSKPSMSILWVIVLYLGMSYPNHTDVTRIVEEVHIPIAFDTITIPEINELMVSDNMTLREKLNSAYWIGYITAEESLLSDSVSINHY